MTRHELNIAVREGRLVRARRDRYVDSETPDAVVRAVRVGGMLTCLSLLELLDVFAQSNGRLHVHMAGNASRMRSPHDRRRRLAARGARRVRLHWLPLTEPAGNAACVDPVDALAHAVLCQRPRAAVATLDSALNRGVIGRDELEAVFAQLPARYQVLHRLVDGRAESGPETIMRLIAQSFGRSVELQVNIDGVGRVDLVVDGWLIIECDSKAFHSTWADHVEDRRRDLAAAAKGYTTIRPTATVIMNHPEIAWRAVQGLLATRP